MESTDASTTAQWPVRSSSGRGGVGRRVDVEPADAFHLDRERHELATERKTVIDLPPFFHPALRCHVVDADVREDCREIAILADAHVQIFHGRVAGPLDEM